MPISTAIITWQRPPGSTGTLFEYKLPSSSVWIQPTSPANPTNLSTYPINISNGTTYDVRLTNFSAGCFPSTTTFTIETGTNASTWSLALNGTTGFLNITVNGTLVLHQTTSGTGSISFSVGDSVFVFAAQTVSGTVNLAVTDVTTSTVLSNTSTTGPSPATSFSFTANGDVYSMVQTNHPTTTTTTTSTTTTTTTT